MSGYDDPHAWERKEAYLAAIHEFSQQTPCTCKTHQDLSVLGMCSHGVDLDRDFCPHGCRV